MFSSFCLPDKYIYLSKTELPTSDYYILISMFIT